MYDLIIVGGGAAGLLCAIAAKTNNLENILVLEKDPTLGGLLNLADFNISCSSQITGQAYKQQLLDKFNKLNVNVQLNTHVIHINDKGHIVCVSPTHGMQELSAKTIILANGAKERGRNVMNLTGDRCPGMLTLLNAKKIIKNEKLLPGHEIVIFGTNHLYMLSHELPQLNIKAVIGEIDQPNLIHCDVERYPNYVIKEVYGTNRIEQIVIANHEDEVKINCDTIILAQGMLSDGLVAFRSGIVLNPQSTGPQVNEQFQTSRSHVYACGNGIYIHESIEAIESECEHLINSLSSSLQSI